MRTISTVKIKIFLFLVLLTIGIQSASSEVCYESGIYVSRQLDLHGINSQSSIFTLPLERTYNSSASQLRMFGLGWGTVYETALSVTDEDVIIAQVGGSGKKYFYALKPAPSKKQKTATVPLQDDCSFTSNHAWHSTSGSPTGKQKIKNGDVYKCRLGCAGGYVQKEPEGFKRTLSDRSEFFDSRGQLYKITDKTGAIVVIHRNGDDRISNISNNMGHSLAFTYSADGFVTSVKRDNKKISYSYQGKSLVRVDIEDEAQNYAYNDDNRLVKTFSQQEAVETVTYDSGGRVLSVQLPNDSQHTYQYLDHTSTLVEQGYTHGLINTESHDKQQVWQRTVLYARKTNLYGISHVSRMLKKNDLGRDETLYQECGLPVSQVWGKSKTLSQYNDDCRLVMQNNGKTIKKLSYDKKHQKISKVTTTDLQSNRTTWSSFTYDLKGNLIHGKTSGALEAHLVYSFDNRISSMTDQKGQVLSFEYNNVGQPTLISMADVGKLVISYGEDGEIASIKVADGKGHEVSVKLMDTVQNLLRIVKPAGIDLHM